MIKRIAIDLDGVVFDSITQICNLYNYDFQYYPGFTPVEPENIQTWDFDELTCASRTYIDQYFCQPRFFKDIKLMKCASWIINKLADEFEIVFVSSGRIPNLKLKELWKQEYFPFARLIGVDRDHHEDKAHIQLQDAVFIDDVTKNLETSNAPIKICYGEVYPWNQDWTGLRCETWSELYGVIKSEVHRANQV